MSIQKANPNNFDANQALTAEELEEVTGYKSARKQYEALKEAGIFCIFKKATNSVWTNWHQVNNPKRVDSYEGGFGLKPNLGAING